MTHISDLKPTKRAGEDDAIIMLDTTQTEYDQQQTFRRRTLGDIADGIAKLLAERDVEAVVVVLHDGRLEVRRKSQDFVVATDEHGNLSKVPVDKLGELP